MVDEIMSIEETTFWMLVQILSNRRYSMKDCYRSGLPKLRLVMFMTDQLLKARLPDAHRHIVRISADLILISQNEQFLMPEAYASPFIIALFTNRFPYKTSLRFFDIFLCEGWKMVLRTMVAIIKFSKGTNLPYKFNK